MNKLYEEFISAPDEFSPMPFWFWNDAFCENEIKVLVTNSMANHYTKHRIPSGLLGTQKLKILK